MKNCFIVLIKIFFLAFLSCVNNSKTEPSQELINGTPSIVNGQHIIIDEFNAYSPKNKSTNDSLTINISFRSTIDSIAEQLVNSDKLDRSTFLFIKEFDKFSGIPRLEEIDESTFELYVLDGSGDYEIKFRPQICDSIEILFLLNDQLQYPVDDDNIRWIQDIATIEASILWNCKR